jgi:excisionase family DNA binding protein
VNDPWLTVRQVATELQVARKTIRRWIATDRLNASKVTDRSGWRIRRSDLERALNSLSKEY